LRVLDYAERNGFIRGVVKDIIHDPGRGAPIAKIQFNDPYHYKKSNVQWTATEGMYTGQFIYCGKKGAFRYQLSSLPASIPRSLSPCCRCGVRLSSVAGTRLKSDLHPLSLVDF
ncbi:MAG: hypothetical protein SGPRY_014136, partial [Prymnesium sp.]